MAAGGFGDRLRRRRRAGLEELVRLASRPLARPRPDDPFHQAFGQFARLAEETLPAGYAVLELGSYGSAPDGRLPGAGSYTGVDMRPGPNVDVVGDVHRLSQLVEGPFDAVYAIATLEHLAMPWAAVLEVNRVLRPGGLLFLATHPTWPPHELPWDFWRFQPASFRSLLNRHTGFELLRVSDGLPALVVPLVRDPAMRTMHHSRASLGVAVIARKVGEPSAELHWPLGAADVVDDAYPA